MPFRVTCPGCRTACVIPDGALGQNVRCKQCSRVFQVSGAKPSPAAPPVIQPEPGTGTEAPWWKQGQAEAPPRPAPAASTPPPPAPKKPPKKEELPVLEAVEEVAERLEEVAELEPLEGAPEDALQTRPSPRPTAKKLPPAKKLVRSSRREAEVPQRSSGIYWAIGIAAALLLIGGGVGLYFLLSDKEEENKPVQTAEVGDVNKDKKPDDKKPEKPADKKPGDKKPDNGQREKPGDKVVVEKPTDKKPDDKKPGDKVPGDLIAPPPPPVDVKPPVIAQNKVTHTLPAAASDAVVGGGGRYLILHLPQQRKLAVFDISEAKVKGYVPAEADDVKFAAGMDKLLVVLPGSNIIQRWDLHTLKREVAAPLDVPGTVNVVAMGSASNGPLLIGSSARFIGTTFLDIKTLKPVDLRRAGPTRVSVDPGMYVRASADGRVFAMWQPNISPQGLSTLVLTGKEKHGHYHHTSVGHIVPGPDGKIVYTARGLYTNQGKAIGKSGPNSNFFCLPAVQGNLYLSVTSEADPLGRGPQVSTVAVHMAGETRTLITLNDIELPKGINAWGREAFGMDRRILLIPSAKVLVTIPETDKVVLHRFDLGALLEKSGLDFLFVTSQPPAAARRGSRLSYQLAVKSKQGGLKYKVDSGPKGMSISPAGLLTWQVPLDFAQAETDVSINIGDKSGQEVAHSFKLAIGGEAVAQAPPDPPMVVEKPPKPADPPEKEPVKKPADPPPMPVVGGGIKPPALKEDRQEVKLPSAASQLAIGGGGRYIILHLAEQRKLAVFDANEAKIVKYLPAAADNVTFTAGQDKLFVALPDKNILQRWSLSSLERELTTQIPGAGRVHHLAMGSASRGPLLLARGEQFRVATSFLDIKTLKPLNVRPAQGDVPGVSADTYLRVSADGRVFGLWNPNVSPQGVQVWVLTGEKLEVHGNGESSGHVVPGPDGKIIYTGRGLYTNQAKRIGKLDTPGGVYFLPSIQGNFALSVTPPNLSLHFAGETRSLLPLKDVEVPKGVNQWGREPFGTDHRILLIPAAKLLITVPETNDRLVLHHFDPDEALAKSGVDFLFVSSQPPAEARKGALLSYQLVVKSKQGGLKYKVDSGPKGMTVSPTGLLTWKVPADFAEVETDVIVSIADKGGQEVFHTFKLSIGAAGPADPPVKEPPPKEPPVKEPPPKPMDPPAKEPDPKPMDPQPEAPGSGVYGIKPPTLDKAVVERKLPSAVSSVVAGGGGRYLILHLPREQKLAVFDANEGKVTRYIPAADDNVLFAAGLDKLLVVLPATHIIQRWSLSTGKREVAAKFPVKGMVRRLLMGAASHGPLLVGGESDDGRSTGAVFLDVRTLKPIRYQLAGQGDFGFDATTSLRVSADGRVFGKWQPNLSPQGITTLVLTGAVGRVHANSGLSVGHVVPGPDGKTIYTGRGTFTNQVKAIGKSGGRDGVYSLPPAHGDDYFMTLKIVGTVGAKSKSTVSVHLRGDEQPFATLDEVELPDDLNQWDRDAITSDMRLHLIPAAKLIVTLAPTNDKLVLHRFDPESELQKSGKSFLIVTSRPPTSVRRGAKFSYQITAKSAKGGLKYKIESGPKGMTVSPEGKVTWAVPFNQATGSTEVIVSISDSGDQERFHSFTLNVRR